MDGKWTEWYDTGIIISQGNYKENQKEGMWVFFDKYGAKYKEQNFINNRPDGKWTEYYQNGKKSGEGSYIKQTKDGVWQYWDQKGNVIYRVIYSKGKKISETKPEADKKKNKTDESIIK